MLRHRKLLVLLLIAIAVPATAQSFGFSLGAAATPDACLAIGNAAFRVASGARADYTVRIDPAAASPDLRIEIAETADTADFIFVDDEDALPRCRRAPAGIRSVKVDPAAAAPDLVVGLATATAPADFRIFVRSRWFEPEAAAALFAAAHAPLRIQAAALSTSR